MVVGYCVLLYEDYVSVQNSHSGDVATNDEGGHALQERPDQHGMGQQLEVKSGLVPTDQMPFLAAESHFV